ncbi:MAG: sigma-70 family RNA polymerase sigma factor, partial [Blautia obeum]
EALLDTVENEELLQILLSTDKKTLQMIVLKMMGYAPKEISHHMELAGADGLYKTAEIKGKYQKVHEI